MFEEKGVLHPGVLIHPGSVQRQAGQTRVAFRIVSQSNCSERPCEEMDRDLDVIFQEKHNFLVTQILEAFGDVFCQSIVFRGALQSSCHATTQSFR